MDNQTDKILELEAKIKLYEQNGTAKLYYSLNRKMNEMADILNKNNLVNLSLEDSKDKTFERLEKIWVSVEKISVSAETLGRIAKITGSEEEDTAKKPFANLMAERRD